jgi:hypothetical protein
MAPSTKPPLHLPEPSTSVQSHRPWPFPRIASIVRAMRKPFLLGFLLIATPASAGDLPDPTLTPGTVMTTDAAAVCTPGYAKSVRHVSGKVKAQVYAEYGIVSHRSGEYEVDHLISLELGGSNDVKNLWPALRTSSHN